MSGLDANTIILLHFDSESSGAITDSSSYGHSAALTADGAISTDGPKFGAAALESIPGGTEGYGWAGVTFASDMALSASFTVDFWFKSASAPTGTVCFWSTSGGGYRLRVYNNTLRILGCATYPDFSAYMDDAWHHFALVVVINPEDPGDEVNTVYVDGELFCSIPCTTTVWFVAPESEWHIGEIFEYELKMDEFRFSNSIRYTQGFTPATAAYDASIGPTYLYEEVNDTVVLTEDVWDLRELVQDGAELTDSAICSTITSRSVLDTVFAIDNIACGMTVTLQEAIDLSDTLTAMLGVLISEYLSVTDGLLVNMSGTKSVTSALTMSDGTKLDLYLSLSDAIDLADTTTANLSISILEYLGFTELVTAIGQLNHGVNDAIDLQDSSSLGFSHVMSEVLSLVDVATVIGALLNSLSDSMAVIETAVGSLTMPASISESLSIADAIASQGILFNIVYDTLHLTLTVELNGELWECYVLNTPKFLPSIYSGFDFNSYAVFENRAYGCKVDGIYELTGDTDNGVAFHTGVQLSETKFGSPNQKRFRKAYVGVSGSSPLMVMETEDGNSITYSINSEGEVDASRALQSKKWKLSVIDFDQLDFIKLIPVVLAK